MLTPKEQRFVTEYLVDSNGTQAAIRAGYAPKSAHVTASQLLRRPKVAEALYKVEAKVAGPRIATAAERREFLTRVMRESSNEFVRLKACDQLNKLAGEYLEKREITTPVAPVAVAFVFQAQG